MDTNLLEVAGSSETALTLAAWNHLNSIRTTMPRLLAYCCLNATREQRQGFTQTTIKGDDYNYHKGKLQLSPRETYFTLLTLKNKDLATCGFQKQIYTHQLKPAEANPVSERKSCVCFSLLTSMLESFGHKSTPSNKPWTEAKSMRILQNTMHPHRSADTPSLFILVAVIHERNLHSITHSKCPTLTLTHYRINHFSLEVTYLQLCFQPPKFKQLLLL